MMNNKELQDYIINERIRQVDDQTITATLLAAGWNHRLVTEAFQEIDQNSFKSTILEKLRNTFFKTAVILFFPGVISIGLSFFVMLSPRCFVQSAMPWWCELLSGIGIIGVFGGLFCLVTAIFLYGLQYVLNKRGLIWGIFLTYSYLLAVVYFLEETLHSYYSHVASLILPIIALSLVIKFRSKFNKKDFFIVSGVTVVIIFIAFAPWVNDFMDEQERAQNEKYESEYNELMKKYDTADPVVDYSKCEGGLCPYVENGN